MKNMERCCQENQEKVRRHQITKWNCGVRLGGKKAMAQ